MSGDDRAVADLLAYFANGGPDTPIRTTWPDGVECWEVPADDLRPLLDRLASTSDTANADDHQPLNVHSAEGIPFIRCSCGSNPTPHHWLAEHWPGDEASGRAAAEAVLAQQREATP